ncbi:MAG: alpha/beta fold hydrolase, partial [Burkholderiales bacterium]
VARDGVRQFLKETAVDRIGHASPEHVQWYLDSAEGVTPDFLSRFVPLMASEDYTERLTELELSVLVAVPDPDPMVERSEYDRMLRYLRNCTFVAIPGAGHSMTAEIPDRCAQILKSFIANIDNA